MVIEIEILQIIYYRKTELKMIEYFSESTF